MKIVVPEELDETDQEWFLFPKNFKALKGTSQNNKFSPSLQPRPRLNSKKETSEIFYLRLNEHFALNYTLDGCYLTFQLKTVKIFPFKACLSLFHISGDKNVEKQRGAI